MTEADFGLSTSWIEDMLADERRTEVVTVIQAEDLALYQQAAKDSSFKIEVVAKPGQVHYLDVTGEDEDFDRERLIRDNELAIEILTPEGFDRYDYTLFWRSFDYLRKKSKVHKP